MCIEKGEKIAKKMDANLERQGSSTNSEGVTFTIDQPQCHTALEGVITALERILDAKIDVAPRKSVEAIIRYIIAICIDSSVQLRAAQETIITMAGVIDSLSKQRSRPIELETDRKTMEENYAKIQRKYDKLKSEKLSFAL